MVAADTIALVGCGSVFEAIAADQAAYAPVATLWLLRRAESVAALAGSAEALLADLPERARVFIAVDSNAINYARLELYGLAKVRGLPMATLVHGGAYVAPDARLGDNVWVGPQATIGGRCKVGANVLVGARARIDSGAQVGMNGWVGPGASIGAGATVGSHCVVGADVHLLGGLQVGKHCVVTQPGLWKESLPAGSFVEPGYTHPARVIGAGYSWHSRA